MGETNLLRIGETTLAWHILTLKNWETVREG
jgi:hypothetical protein